MLCPSVPFWISWDSNCHLIWPSLKSVLSYHFLSSTLRQRAQNASYSTSSTTPSQFPSWDQFKTSWNCLRKVKISIDQPIQVSCFRSSPYHPIWRGHRWPRQCDESSGPCIYTSRGKALKLTRGCAPRLHSKEYLELQPSASMASYFKLSKSWAYWLYNQELASLSTRLAVNTLVRTKK